MARIVNMLDAKSSLSRLVHDLGTGAEQEFIIARNGRPAARLVPRAVVGSTKLAAQAKEAILSADEVFVSTASIWEIAIKHGRRRADMPVSAVQALQGFKDAAYELLDIRPEHAVAVAQLGSIHNDPFDGMLVAQALLEPLALITRDALVPSYSAAFMKVA